MSYKKPPVPRCTPRTAVAYARYSSAGQRDVSIEQQLNDIRAYALREGYTIIHEYADHACSGFKNPSARAEFQAMLAASESGTFDTVLAWKVDRFGRNREDATAAKGRLRRAGVRIEYVMEPIPEGAAGVLTEGMLEAIAQWYSENLRENVTRGMRDNARKCLYNGTKILGYTRGPDGHYQVVPEEAETVRYIYSMYASGYSAARIARKLNDQGLRTSRGKLFSPEALMRIVTNERYTGVYIWGDIRVPDGMPAIIEKDVFEEAQRMKKKTGRHIEQGVGDYLLTGKAFCGHCGAAMIGDCGTSKDGTRHHYYSCQSKKARKGCRKKSLRKDYLEDLVVDFVLDHVLSDEQIEKTAAEVLAIQEEQHKSSPLASMEKEYAEVQKKIENVNQAIAAGVWSDSTVTMLNDLEGKAKDLRVSIDMTRFTESQLLDYDRILFFLHRFTEGDRRDPLLRQHIIDTFINAVYVFDDHLDIVTNNCEGNHERFPLEELPEDPDPDVGPECSFRSLSGVLSVTHPNTRITIFKVAI